MTEVPQFDRQDGYERLWVPHRMAYIRAEKPSATDQPACPFCAAPGKDDAEGLVVRRGRTAFVVMNLFPYNSGHLLVCPYRHIPMLTDTTDEEAAELVTLSKAAMRTLTEVYGPGGFNLGMNQGAVAGAGVAGHLHQHVVPRFFGDSNFMPIVAQTRALPELLEDSRQRLAAAWQD